MSFLKKMSVLALSAAAAVTFVSPEFAKAEGFALQDWSSRGASLAGGLVARGGDAASVSYNPAAITELEGTQILFGGEYIHPINTVVGTGGQSKHSETKQYFAPHGYITHKVNEAISVGFGAFSRFGLGNDYGSSFFVPNSVYDVELITFTVSPVIAWRVNDKLSLGFGLELAYGDVDFNQNVKKTLANGLPVDTTLSMTGDAWSPAFNLSVHYRFNEQWKAGFVYRSHNDFDFDGELSTAHPLFAGRKFSGSAMLYTPDSYTLALAYYPMPELSFEAQVQYNTWSRYSNLTINVPSSPFPGLNKIEQKKDWRDTWFFSLSAEYQALDWLTLRGGVSYETSPVKEAYADFIAPAHGRWKYGAGLGFQYDNWTLDVAYVYHDILELRYNHSAYAPVADHIDDAHAHTCSFSIGYKF